MPVENRGTKRNPHWRYAFTIRGVRYRAAIPEARTQFEAERAEVEAKQAVFEGKYGRPTGEYDFAKFVGDPDAKDDEFEAGTYLAWAKENKRSWRHDRFRAKVLIEFFKDKTFAQISPMLIEKFKSERRKSLTKRGTQRSPASVNRELELLSGIFTRAVSERITETNPCSKVKLLKADNKRVQYLLDEEETLLFAQFKGRLAHLRPLVIVAIGTGMRRGDQLNLKWEKVDFQRGIIYVPNAKTGKDYPVPMSSEVREVLLEMRRESGGSEYVFVNPKTGKPYIDLKKGFKEACSLAEIKNLRWHDLRHTFGTRIGEDGHSEATIAELMGHTDPRTTRRYTHGTERAKREAVEAASNRGGRACPKSAPDEERLPVLTVVNS
jgi:integrase